MRHKRATIATCKGMSKAIIRLLEQDLGITYATMATMKCLEVIAALERLDNELVEAE